MKPATAQVEGLAALLAALEGMETASRKDLNRVARDAAKPTLNAARAEVPVSTGKLRGSIRIAPTTRGVAIRAGSGRVPYAKVIHFGHPKRNIRARPFLFSAVDATANQVAQTYMDELVALWNEEIT